MRLTLAILGLVSSGCVSTHVVALGPRQAARPRDCPIRVLPIAPEELHDDYVRVGTVCVGRGFGVGPPEAVADAVRHASGERDALFARACGLGGDVVVLAGACATKGETMEFAVLRARSTAAKDDADR